MKKFDIFSSLTSSKTEIEISCNYWSKSVNLGEMRNLGKGFL